MMPSANDTVAADLEDGVVDDGNAVVGFDAFDTATASCGSLPVATGDTTRNGAF